MPMVKLCKRYNVGAGGISRCVQLISANGTDYNCRYSSLFSIPWGYNAFHWTVTPSSHG